MDDGALRQIKTCYIFGRAAMMAGHLPHPIPAIPGSSERLVGGVTGDIQRTGNGGHRREDAWVLRAVEGLEIEVGAADAPGLRDGGGEHLGAARARHGHRDPGGIGLARPAKLVTVPACAHAHRAAEHALGQPVHGILPPRLEAREGPGKIERAVLNLLQAAV